LEVRAQPAQQVPRVRWKLQVLPVLAVPREHWGASEQQVHLVLQVQRRRAPTELPVVPTVSEQLVLGSHSVR
jgi:hypothetical protein